MRKLFPGIMVLATVFLLLSGCEKSIPAAASPAPREDAFKAMLQMCRQFRSGMSDFELARDAQLNSAFKKLIEYKRSNDPAIRDEAWRTMIWIQNFCPGPEFTADQWAQWLEQIEAQHRA